jgi:hypothetical protein
MPRRSAFHFCISLAEAARVHEEHLKNRRKKVAEGRPPAGQHVLSEDHQGITIQRQDRSGMWRTVRSGVSDSPQILLQAMQSASNNGRLRVRAVDHEGRVVDILTPGSNEEVDRIERCREIVHAAMADDHDLVRELVEQELTRRALAAIDALRPLVTARIFNNDEEEDE